jgi:hypothetical protein
VHAILLPGAAYYLRALWFTSDSLGDKTRQMQRKECAGFVMLCSHSQWQCLRSWLRLNILDRDLSHRHGKIKIHTQFEATEVPYKPYAVRRSQPKEQTQYPIQLMLLYDTQYAR